MNRFFAILLLVLTINSYDLEGEVLVLHDSDFPSILQQFPYILIQFYAPWCGHCKQLAPAYTEAAAQLKNKGSQIKLAKVDATIQKNSANSYGVRGYPTIFYFVNGEKLEFKGQRSKQGIINWVEKKILPPVIDINSQQDLNNLKEGKIVAIVLFSSDAATIESFKAIALNDDDNIYYIASGSLLDTQPEGTIQIHRNFDQITSLTGIDSNTKNWILRNSRPVVLEFDQRTINTVFGDGTPILTLFNSKDDSQISSIFSTYAKAYAGKLIFTQIDTSSQHFNKFAEYIKVSVVSPRILIIQGKSQQKYIYSGSVQSVSVESISQFVQSYENNSLKKHKLTDLVVEDVQQSTQEGEQL